MCLRTVLLWCSQQSKHLLELIRRISKLVKEVMTEYVTWSCFKFWPMENIFQRLQANSSLVMTFYEIAEKNCHLWHFAEFIQTQKRYLPSLAKQIFNLKTTHYIKPKFFLSTKLLENLLLSKYLTFVAETLVTYYTG